MKFKAILSILAAAALSCVASAECTLKAGDSIVLIGDSITDRGCTQPYGYYHQLTNAAERVCPELNLKFTPLGFSGYKMEDWVALERQSVKQDTWTWYKNPGWNLKTVFDGKVDVVMILMGMNDILQPTVRDDDASCEAWLGKYRTLVTNIKNRCKPRFFVFGTITPLTADPNSPKNVVRKRLNAMAAKLAAEEGGCVADCGNAVNDVIQMTLGYDTRYRAIPDFVHPAEYGNIAIAKAFAEAVGEEHMEEYLSNALYEKLSSFANVRGMTLSYRFNPLPTNRVSDDSLVYEVEYSWSDDNAEREVERIPEVTLTAPEGWEVTPKRLNSTWGRFLVRGAPTKLVNRLTLTAKLDKDTRTEFVDVPTPWVVSEPFDFETIWKGQTWLTNAVPPKAAKDCKWMLSTGTWDYDGNMAPGSIDPYHLFFGYRNDSFYARRAVYSEKDRDVTLKLWHKTFSATLGFVIEMNGQEVARDTMNRNGRKAIAHAAKLKKGWNELLIRCDHANWQRQFGCDIEGTAGDDLADLRYDWRK